MRTSCWGPIAALSPVQLEKSGNITCVSSKIFIKLSQSHPTPCRLMTSLRTSQRGQRRTMIRYVLYGCRRGSARSGTGLPFQTGSIWSTSQCKTLRLRSPDLKTEVTIESGAGCPLRSMTSAIPRSFPEEGRQHPVSTTKPAARTVNQFYFEWTILIWRKIQRAGNTKNNLDCGFRDNCTV